MVEMCGNVKLSVVEKLSVNVSGGSSAKGHPAVATGVSMYVAVAMKLTGQTGEYAA